MGNGTTFLIISICIAVVFNAIGYSSIFIEIFTAGLGLGSLDTDILQSLITLAGISIGSGVTVSFLISGGFTAYTIPITLLFTILNFFLTPLGLLTEASIPFELKFLIFGVMQIMLIITVLSYARGYEV